MLSRTKSLRSYLRSLSLGVVGTRRRERAEYSRARCRKEIRITKPSRPSRRLRKTPTPKCNGCHMGMWGRTRSNPSRPHQIHVCSRMWCTRTGTCIQSVVGLRKKRRFCGWKQWVRKIAAATPGFMKQTVFDTTFFFFPNRVLIIERNVTRFILFDVKDVGMGMRTKVGGRGCMARTRCFCNRTDLGGST